MIDDPFESKFYTCQFGQERIEQLPPQLEKKIDEYNAGMMAVAVNKEERKKKEIEASHRYVPINLCCFNCRKIRFRWCKGTNDSSLDAAGDLLPCRNSDNMPMRENTGICGECEHRMYVVGPSFAIPQKRKGRAWENLRKLAEAGYSFSPCDRYREADRRILQRLGVDHPGDVK